ncbi:N-acetylmuramoyl-L-alanine amidase [uncultured Planococcus sp.]|uniref:N-acetylmuramoyl-L-alanine amidase n=1 Tax=uncultured Planococcus sp. TaxID=337815 RepID=UPI00260337FC|nr:N-acetylmuramoyl-L-alanine amidase [uncultured Planococcus sp.]
MAKASDYLVAMCDGHGPNTAGKRTPYIASLGRSIRENEFNKPVVNMLEGELKRCGFRTLQTAPTDADTGLTARTNAANAAGADIYISVHFNAVSHSFGASTAQGFSVHIQAGSSNSSKAYKLAKLAVDELAKGTRQINRGVVKQNLAITRQTRMPAILVEGGFMDDEREALLMIDPAFQREVAQELAQAVCKYFGVAYVGGGSLSTTKPVTVARDYVMEDDRGPAVSAMQSDLNKAGASPKLVVDGIFGAASTRAVKAFQTRYKLTPVDGIYGVKSASKMAQVLAPAPPEKEANTVAETTYKRVAQASASLAAGQEWVIENAISDGTYPDRPLTRAEFWETLRRYNATYVRK